MSAARLGRKADIAPNTMTRLQKDVEVSLTSSDVYARCGDAISGTWWTMCRRRKNLDWTQCKEMQWI